METRKLQAVGGGTTFAVSLPKPWIENLGLSAGDEIMLDPRSDGTIVLSVARDHRMKGPDREVRVDAADASGVLRTIIGLYVSGLETTTLIYKSPSTAATRAGVADACERLHGLQVVEEGPDRVMLQDLADPTEFNMDKGLRRMQLLVIQLLSDAMRLAAGEGDAEAILRECQRHESEVDRLLILLMKQHNVLLQRSQFSASTAVPASESLWYMFVAQFLERIADYVMRISASCAFIARHPDLEVTTRLRLGLAQARTLVEDSVRAFNTKDAQLANSVISQVLVFAPGSGTNEMFDHFTSPRSEPQVFSCQRCIKFFSVIESIERLGLYAKSIAEMAINRSLGTRPDDATPVV